MSLFNVDKTKCKKDGICISECPVSLIEFQEKEGYPSPIPNAETMCINCGHCVAVCPHGALSHKSIPVEKYPAVQKELLPSASQVEQFLKSRRSIRTYKEEPVALKDISKLIDIARYSPSGHNSQAVKWIVVYDKEKVRAITGMVVDWMKNMEEKQQKMAAQMGISRMISKWNEGKDLICRSAPHLIFAYSPTIDATGQASCIIALSYLELAAASLNLGACWAGYLHFATGFWQPLQQAIGLSKGYKCHGAMMIGHPKYTYHRLPVRNTPDIAWCR